MAGERLDPTVDDPPDDPPAARLAALARRIQAACLATERTVALAESCTGGLVAAALTAIPGSSGYFSGGIVSYANAAKRDLLGVDPAVLEAHGAVSAQVARAMALGARAQLGADVAASVTGIAGPGGGTPGKPVGLTYVAVVDAGGADVRRVIWTGDRTANRLDSAVFLLEVLLARVEGMVAPAAGRTASDARSTPGMG